MSEKPNCYKCVYRGTLPGDAHSCCKHPANAEILNNPLAQVFGILAGVHRVAPIKVDAVGIKVVGNPDGIRRGWFNYSLNFDPAWLESCDGFKSKEE